jgi:hypothetical protein
LESLVEEDQVLRQKVQQREDGLICMNLGGRGDFVMRHRDVDYACAHMVVERLLGVPVGNL